MRNAANRKAIRAAEKRSKEYERQRIAYIVGSMDTVQGRAWFYDLLSKCEVFHANFHNDPFTSGRVEGARFIGLYVYNDIVTNCPDQFVTMMKEAKIQEQIDDRRTDAEPELDLDPDDEFPGSENGDGGTS